MTETRIGIAELKGEGSDMIKELAEFLKKKTNAEVDTETDQLVIKDEEETVSRPYLRMLLRKFIHKKELKDYFRVIGGKENMLIIKEKKVPEEE